jgi:hypothetical protein
MGLVNKSQLSFRFAPSAGRKETNLFCFFLSFLSFFFLFLVDSSFTAPFNGMKKTKLIDFGRQRISCDSYTVSHNWIHERLTIVNIFSSRKWIDKDSYKVAIFFLCKKFLFFLPHHWKWNLRKKSQRLICVFENNSLAATATLQPI